MPDTIAILAGLNDFAVPCAVRTFHSIGTRVVHLPTKHFLPSARGYFQTPRAGFRQSSGRFLLRVTAVVFIGFVAVKVMVFPLRDADRPEGREDVTELMAQYSIAIRQATLIGLAGTIPFQR